MYDNCDQKTLPSTVVAAASNVRKNAQTAADTDREANSRAPTNALRCQAIKPARKVMTAVNRYIKEKRVSCITLVSTRSTMAWSVAKIVFFSTAHRLP